MLSRRDRKKEEKRRRLRQAARELFGELGYEATTTRAISERADVGAGTLYAYYPDKTQLLLDVFLEDIAGQIDEAMAAIDSGAPLVDQLMACFEHMFDYWDADRSLSRSIIREVTFMDPEARLRHDGATLGFLQRLAQLFERARQRGEVRDDVVAVQAATATFAMYTFHVLGWLTGVTSRRLAGSMLRSQLELLMRGAGRPDDDG